MRKTQQKNRHLLVMAGTVLVLALSACGPSKADATPTMSVQQIYTAAFHTLTAQQATQMALTPPTATASQTPPATVTPTKPSSVGTAATLAGGGQACDNSVFVNDV